MRGKAIVLMMVLAGGMRTGAARQSSASAPFEAPDRFNLPGPDRRADMDLRRQVMAQQLKSANLERQKQLARDARDLLNIAGELQSGAQRSDGGLSQAEMLHQVEAIEKLAHNVKERMKGPR